MGGTVGDCLTLPALTPAPAAPYRSRVRVSRGFLRVTFGSARGFVKRSTIVRLVAMGAAAGSVAACGDLTPSTRVWADQNACRLDGLSAELCAALWTQAEAAHRVSAPQFASLRDCISWHNSCVETGPPRGFFVPQMIGVIASTEPRNGVHDTAGLWRAGMGRLMSGTDPVGRVPNRVAFGQPVQVVKCHFSLSIDSLGICRPCDPALESATGGNFSPCAMVRQSSDGGGGGSGGSSASATQRGGFGAVAHHSGGG